MEDITWLPGEEIRNWPKPEWLTWELAMLQLMLSASSERVDEEIPRPAEAKSVLSVHIFRCSSFSIASLINWFMYWHFVERMVLSWIWIRWPWLMLCSATANMSGCSARMWLFDLGLHEMAGLPYADLISLERHAVHTRSPESWYFLQIPKKTWDLLGG